MQFKEAVFAFYLTRRLRMAGNVELPGNLECGHHLLGEFRNEGQTIVRLDGSGETKPGDDVL